MKKIIVVNPGATSTKVAYFNDKEMIWRHEITYDNAVIDQYEKVFDQFDLRYKDIHDLLVEKDIESIDVAVGRGGLIGPVAPGAIIVDENLINKLKNDPMLEHASNLGCALADHIVKDFGVDNANAYVYDPVTVDSMSEVARITGLKEVKRSSVGHHLNMRAVAIRASEDLGKSYKDTNVIVVHLGGGASASAHQYGQVVDFVSDDEIMFSAERSGGLPIKEMMPLLKSMSLDEFNKKVRKEAGLQAHCGTKDLREIEDRINNGDQYAKLVIEAMALGVAKCIASLAATLEGQVDCISVTGGMVHYPFLREEIERRVSFIAPFKPYPGEFELQALAYGGLRVINGEEEANYYTK